MKIWKRALSVSITGVMLAAAPMTALAASPEFARTSEEWARLRDNKMEYDELEDLDCGIQYHGSDQSAGFE